MAAKSNRAKILVIDVGGSNIKLLATGVEKRIKIPSYRTMSAAEMVQLVLEATHEAKWKYDCISLGVPCVVQDGAIVKEPVNLGMGWIAYDFNKAFGCPVKVINDAAMQAYGCYNGGTMLFLGFGTGLGTTLIVDHTIMPLEGGHLPYEMTKKSIEDFVGKAGKKKLGEKSWLKHSLKIIASLRHAFCATDLVIGGGNADKIQPFPEGARKVTNAAAFTGGFRLWQDVVPNKAKPSSHSSV